MAASEYLHRFFQTWRWSQLTFKVIQPGLNTAFTMRYPCLMRRITLGFTRQLLRVALTFGMCSVRNLTWILSTAFACNICQSGRLQAIQQKDHLWAQASFTQVDLRIRLYLACVGTEICTVTATTKITTKASLSTAGLCHPVTCSGCYLEKPYNVALFPLPAIMPA